MPINDLLRKRIYACIIGPEISDEAALTFMDACIASEPYIAAVVVNLCQVRLAAAHLKDTGIGIVGPIAYPLGSMPGELKSVQIEECIRDGASGVAAVMKLEALRAADYADARRDAQAIAAASGNETGLVALIGNAANLTDAQSLESARIAADLGCIYVTNTGFGADSRLSHVEVIRQALGEDPKVIAAGGIRTEQQATAYLRAGADGVATSTPFQILQQFGVLAAGDAPA